MPTSQPQSTRIRVANPPLEGNNRTYLTSDVNIAETVLDVFSTTGSNFLTTGDVDYYLMIEDYSREKAEIVLVDSSDSSTDDSHFKISALIHSHEASDPITYIPYNKVRIYGTATTGGAKTLITTIDIDCTHQFTEYIYEGTDYSYFYTAYYNSNNDKISAYSEEIYNTVLGRTSAKQVVQSALRKALTTVDENQNGKLNWDICLETLNDGLDEIMTRKRKWIFLHTVDETSTDTVASQQYISKPSDLSILEKIKVDGYELDYISKSRYNDYTDSGASSNVGKPQYYTIKNNKFYLYPTPDSVYNVSFEYYKYPTEVEDLTDQVDKEFVSILKYYCAAHFCYIRGNETRGDKMFTLYQNVLSLQCDEYTGPEQLGDAESIELNQWGESDTADSIYF